MLSELIEEKKSEYAFLPEYVNTNLGRSDEDALSVMLMKQDLKKFKGIFANPQLINLESSKSLLKEYNVDNLSLVNANNISTYNQYMIINSINKRMQSIFEKTREKTKQKRQNDLDLIIKDRQDSYHSNQTYDMDFFLVDLYKSEPFKNLEVELDGIVKEVDCFPIETNFKPKSVAFRANFENTITGEKYKLNEIQYP